MAWRVIVRFSFDNDHGSVVRNQVAAALQAAGIQNTATGTWEAPAATEQDAAARLQAVLDIVSNLPVAGGGARAGQPVLLDHLWLYIDRV